MDKYDELIKDNLITYKDFDEFEKYTNFNKEDFDIEIGCGSFFDVTPSKGYSLKDVLVEYVKDDCFLDVVKMLNEDNPDDKIDMNNNFELVEFMIGEYEKLFKIESTGKYYLDME